MVEDSVEAIRLVPQERSHERNMEQVALFPVQDQESISEPDAEQGLDVPEPQMMEDIVDAIQLGQRKRSHRRVVEQRVSTLVRQDMDDLAQERNVVTMSPKTKKAQRTSRQGRSLR